MTQGSPIVVVDTNVLMDVFLQRDHDAASYLIELARLGRIRLIVPQYVLHEFRGTVLRWIRKRISDNTEIRRYNSESLRSNLFSSNADEIRVAVKKLDESLDLVRSSVDDFIRDVKTVSLVPSHTPQIHYKGDIRYLEGYPPDRPVEGIKDCRIFEAVMDYARSCQEPTSLKYFVTNDSDFEHKEITDDLAGVGFVLIKPGELVFKLRQNAKL